MSFRSSRVPHGETLQRRNLSGPLDFQLKIFQAQKNLPGYYTFKVINETFWAAVLLIVLSIPLFLAAVAVYFFISKSVIFRQLRIGLNGRPFVVYKLRTMHESNLRVVDLGYQPLEKIHNDPRVSGLLGKLLRKYKWDELPQLWNVVKGDMLLIGPRPYPYEENYEIPEHQFIRYAVRPGISGSWQVKGDLKMTPMEKLQEDSRYVEELDLANDFIIFIRTLKVVLFRGES